MDFFVTIAAVAVLVAVFWRFKLMKRKYLEPLFMSVMLFGIVALCQPLLFGLYSHGFTILFTGTIGYIASIHFK
jgi:energy-coupling factor transporter transmembrane protein EcfT